MIRYHLSIGGQTIEGLTEAEVRARLAADAGGAREALLWSDGWTTWVPASQALASTPSGGTPSWLIGSRIVDGAENGAFISTAAWIVLRALAILLAVGALVLWVAVWLDASKASALAVVSALPMQLVWPVAAAIAANILWARGGRARRTVGAHQGAQVGIEVVCSFGEVVGILGIGYLGGVLTSRLLRELLDAGRAPIPDFGLSEIVLLPVFAVGALFGSYIARDLIRALIEISERHKTGQDE